MRPDDEVAYDVGSGESEDGFTVVGGVGVTSAENLVELQLNLAQPQITGQQERNISSVFRPTIETIPAPMSRFSETRASVRVLKET